MTIDINIYFQPIQKTYILKRCCDNWVHISDKIVQQKL